MQKVYVFLLFLMNFIFPNHGFMRAKCSLFRPRTVSLDVRPQHLANRSLRGSTEAVSHLKQGINFSVLNGTDIKVGILVTQWNADIIQGLLQGVNKSLTDSGVNPANVYVTQVPGAYELPMAAKFLASSKNFDVIICLGCLIKGETKHFEYIADATAHGIMKVQLDSMIPCVFGVLTVLNKEQAIKRSTNDTNEGLSWGKTAVEMGLLRTLYSVQHFRI